MDVVASSRAIFGARREGLAAALLLGFYLTFGIPAAVMALAPDLLMVLPHIAAVYLAWRGRPFLSGLTAGIALLVNAKAFFVLAACLFFAWRGAGWLLGGFLIPNIVALIWFGRPYVDQVWRWGAIYSAETFSVRHWIPQDGELGRFSGCAGAGRGGGTMERRPLALEDDRLAAALFGGGGRGLALLSSLLFPASAGDGAARRSRLYLAGPLAPHHAGACC